MGIRPVSLSLGQGRRRSYDRDTERNPRTHQSHQRQERLHDEETGRSSVDNLSSPPQTAHEVTIGSERAFSG
jgi:hypothetical protein